MFQLFEIKQSSMLEYLQGWKWDAGGTHMWWFSSSESWENPLTERQESMIGQFSFFLCVCFIPKRGWQFRHIKPSGLISYHLDAKADKKQDN